MSEQNKHSSFSLLNNQENESSSSNRFSFFPFKRRNNNERERMKKLEKSPMKRSKKSLYRLLVIVTVFLVGDFIVLYFLSSFSRVGQLSVSGYEEVVVQNVIDASSVHAGDSLWETFFNRNEIEEKIVESLPQVKAANVHLESPNHFTFHIQEYETVAYLAHNQTYKKILENGSILKEKQEVTRGGYPILSEFKEGKVLDRFLKEYEKLEATVHKSISEIQYDPTPTDNYRIRLFMNDGNQVLASIPTFSERILYYPLMKKEAGTTLGEFNLEAGAYFTPYEAENESWNQMDETIDETE